MRHFTRIASAVALASAVGAGTAEASGLRGSPASMRAQHGVALEHDFTFLRTSAQVEEFVEEGRLEPVTGNEDYRVNEVSFPYARPEVVLFIERVGRLYHEATGERLVVTSLTRPRSAQPGNAHRLSVHPAGMAVDLRVPASAWSREWLESALLELENEGVLDVTRERNPPHYHVAVFPSSFAEYAAANPLPPRPVKETPIVASVAEQPQVTAAAPASVHEADAGWGFGFWSLTALGGLVLAGGAAARNRMPARRRTDAP